MSIELSIELTHSDLLKQDDVDGIVNIVNVPTKDHWRGNSKISFIEDGLRDLLARVQRPGVKPAR